MLSLGVYVRRPSCRLSQATAWQNMWKTPGTKYNNKCWKMYFSSHCYKQKMHIWNIFTWCFPNCTQLVVNKTTTTKKEKLFFQTSFRMFWGNLYPLNCLHTLSWLSTFFCQSDVELFTQAHQLTFHSHLNRMSFSASTIFRWTSQSMLDVSITAFLVQERQDNGFIRETDELLFKSCHSVECRKPRQLMCIWQLSHSQQSSHKQEETRRMFLSENSPCFY